MSKSTQIIFCSCAYSKVIPEQVREQVLSALKDWEAAIEIVDDLCGLAVRNRQTLRQWSRTENLLIVACYERAVKCLFERAGAALASESRFFNMRTQKAEDIIQSLTALPLHKGPAHEIKFENRRGWTAWFPMIDYDRCKDCRQCLNFCLFGVYALSDEQKVKVVEPANCKTGCPACARVCPEKAIIFAKYGDSPINGAEVSESAELNNKSNPKLAELLKGDVRQVLSRREKTAKRFAAHKTRTDRITELVKLKDKLDIPPDVLKNLAVGKPTENKDG
jgi:Pyruvate/2-oxoacid:ferredoxin oxidoreductase delta subunit